MPCCCHGGLDENDYYSACQRLIDVWWQQPNQRGKWVFLCQFSLLARHILSSPHLGLGLSLVVTWLTIIIDFSYFSCQDAKKRNSQYLREKFDAGECVENYNPHLFSNTGAKALWFKTRGKFSWWVAASQHLNTNEKHLIILVSSS